MQESKSCALPLGDSPLKTLFLTLHASLNYKRKGWVVGLEPTISRTTIWRANQLHHTHHNEPGGIRTLDLRLRRPLLYPAELQTLMKLSPVYGSLQHDAVRKRVMGIEPTYPAWKAGVLPLNYTRRGRPTFSFTNIPSLRGVCQAKPVQNAKKSQTGGRRRPSPRIFQR